MATETAQTKTDKIVFSDGRRGTQTRWLNEQGEWELSCVVVTRLADGTRCRHVYAQKSDLMARVYSFSSLGNVTWEIED